MLNIKIVYSDERQIQDFLTFKINPMFEFVNESNPKELKKAYKYKGAAGARKTPFIGIFENNTIIKGFYEEDKSSNIENFNNWISQYIKEHSKSGFITIKKILEDGSFGNAEFGYTKTFGEGVALYIDNTDRWYHTSIITSIDWENKTFKTLNSTYAFELDTNKTD